MFVLEDSEHYEEVVKRLAEEYSEQLGDSKAPIAAIAKDIAMGVIANVLVGEENAVIQHTGGVWGEKAEAINGEALNPYEVIQYSQSNPASVKHESSESIAVNCLVEDLIHAYRGLQQNADATTEAQDGEDTILGQ